MSQLIFDGIKLQSGQASYALRRIIASLKDNILNDKTHTISAALFSTDLTDKENSIVLIILETIRNAPKHTLLLDAVLRFIDSEARGDWNIIGAAREIRSLANPDVLESPANHPKEYCAAVDKYRQRYPLKVSSAAHAVYLRQVAPGAFIQPQSGFFQGPSTSKPSPHIIPKIRAAPSSDEKAEALRKADGIRRYDQSTREELFYCHSCRGWRQISEFPAKAPTGKKRYVKYCRSCHKRKAQPFREEEKDVEEEKHVEGEEESEDVEEENFLRKASRGSEPITRRNRNTVEGDGVENIAGVVRRGMPGTD